MRVKKIKIVIKKKYFYINFTYFFSKFLIKCFYLFVSLFNNKSGVLPSSYLISIFAVPLKSFSFNE